MYPIACVILMSVQCICRDAEILCERNFDMTVNSVTVNNQYNQFDKYVRNTGKSTTASVEENTQLQEQIDEYIQDTVMLGNNDADDKYKETLERLQALTKKLYEDSLAKDRTFIPPKGPQHGDDIAPFRELLPGWSPYVNVPRSPELDNQPTGMYNPVTMMRHHNAIINHINDWSRALFANYDALRIELLRLFHEEQARYLASDQYIKDKEFQAFVEAMPKGELIRIEDMDTEKLMSLGLFQQIESE